MSGVAIVERSDIHKSCISIESVVNILNDYCEAANAIVTIQKKLAKALRESASAKGTTEIASNAFNASATIFESLVEVDSKFVKFADRECDNISAEVKKWFKKLAKEEKAHDQRMASANAKIKQAGQLYEKKAKKSPRDAQEEHTRYITLLSSLGPEVAQDKYNHSLNVTKRHVDALYSLAASLARVADGEWLRTCEEVRKFGPTIGQLGQWRSLCEGGWTGSLPQDLPDVQHDSEPQRQEMRNLAPPVREQLSQQSDVQETLERPAPEYSSRGTTPTGTLRPPPNYTSQPASDDSSEKVDTHKDRSRSATSLPSLASFPSPPTHFPLPPAIPSVSSHESTTKESRPPQEQVSEPISVPDVTKPVTSSPSIPTEKPKSSLESDPVPSSSRKDSEDQPLGVSPSSPSNVTPTHKLTRSIGENASSSTASVTDSTPGSSSGSRTQPQHATQTLEASSDTEFGVRRPLEATQQSATLPAAAKTVDRNDTGRSTGSVVANLRDKYSRNAGPPSPGTREVPRLPLSVSNLAHRYESSSNHSNSSQLNVQRSPTEERRRVSSDLHVRPSSSQQNPSYEQGTTPFPTPRPHPSPVSPYDSPLSRQPIAETREVEMEYQERERQLRLREQEIMESARELERQRRALNDARGNLPTRDPYAITDRAQYESPSSSPITRPQMLQSQSSTHLAVHSTGTYAHSNGSRTVVSAGASPVLPGEHAPYCGCESCSVSQYRVRDTSPIPRSPRPIDPPIQLRPEKPKGWIRRLSMPVMGNAFSSSSESKKGISSNQFKDGYRSSLASPDEDGRLRHDLGLTGGYTRNRSSVNLSRR